MMLASHAIPTIGVEREITAVHHSHARMCSLISQHAVHMLQDSNTYQGLHIEIQPDIRIPV